jgi:ribonuclease P protein component
MGALVPKRWAKRAVTRNMIKRQIYTLTRLLKPALPEAAYVVRLRTGFDTQQFVSASSSMLKVAVSEELNRLLFLTHEALVSRVKPAPLVPPQALQVRASAARSALPKHS